MASDVRGSSSAIVTTQSSEAIRTRAPRLYEVDSPHDHERRGAAEEGAMKKLIAYKSYFLEPGSYKLRAGGWVPRAWVIRDGRGKYTMRPVWSKTKTSPTLEEANAIAIELGKLWVDKNG